MSLSIVREILVKAASDPDFRKKLLDDPETILNNFDLTNEEKQSLKELDEEKISKAMKIESSEGLAYSNDIRI